MAISAEQIVDMFEKDAKARRRLALVLISDPEVRLAIINATYREVATKQDLEKLGDEIKREIETLRNELKSEIEALRNELKSDINGLRGEMRSEMRVEIDRLYRLVFTSLIGIMLSIVVTVLVRVLLP